MTGKIPVLSPGCRLGTEKVLLMPEGILKLSDSGLRIVQLCDGKKSVQEIISTLQSEFAEELPEKIRDDVVHYIEALITRRALSFIGEPR